MRNERFTECLKSKNNALRQCVSGPQLRSLRISAILYSEGLSRMFSVEILRIAPPHNNFYFIFTVLIITYVYYCKSVSYTHLSVMCCAGGFR